MNGEPWFDTEQNRTLLAICTRKQISNIGIGGIIWGAINIALGYLFSQQNPINIGILILGVIMFGVGVQALRQPTLSVLMAEVVSTALLFLWNTGMAIFNYREIGTFEPRGVIFPIIIMVVFFNSWRKLQPLRDHIASITPEEIKKTKAICKALNKKKIKEEPALVQSHDHKCRAQLLPDSAFFIQRDLMRAFIAPKDSVRQSIAKPDAKKFKVIINHPLGKLVYYFDKKNTEKLQSWLSSEIAPPVQT